MKFMVCLLFLLSAMLASGWRNRECGPSAKCPSSADAVCMARQCTCPIGRIYSVSNATCVQSCSDADLLDTFVRYPGALATFPSLGSPTYGGTEQDCIDACLQNAGCAAVSFEQVTNQTGCSLRTHPAANSIFRSITGVPTNVHLQRMCA